MTYYFSMLALCKKVEVRRAVAVEAEDVADAELFCALEHEYLWCDGGSFLLVQISALHYETICSDLEIECVVL